MRVVRRYSHPAGAVTPRRERVAARRRSPAAATNRSRQRVQATARYLGGSWLSIRSNPSHVGSVSTRIGAWHPHGERKERRSR